MRKATIPERTEMRQENSRLYKKARATYRLSISSFLKICRTVRRTFSQEVLTRAQRDPPQRSGHSCTRKEQRGSCSIQDRSRCHLARYAITRRDAWTSAISMWPSRPNAQTLVLHCSLQKAFCLISALIAIDLFVETVRIFCQVRCCDRSYYRNFGLCRALTAL